jgi:hypothetical protein
LKGMSRGFGWGMEGRLGRWATAAAARSGARERSIEMESAVAPGFGGFEGGFCGQIDRQTWGSGTPWRARIGNRGIVLRSASPEA